MENKLYTIKLKSQNLEELIGKKSKTGEFKYSRPFVRSVHEYRHGIVCHFCQQPSIVVSFSAKTPKYCGLVCRRQNWSHKVKKTK